MDIGHRAGQLAGRACRQVRQAYRAAKQLATDRRIPLWLRVLLGIGFVQTPLPVDEIALLIAVPVLLMFYRQPLRDALATARGK